MINEHNNTESKPHISIVIPCLNEQQYVVKILDDLSKQEGFEDFEVIVVDSNSTDNTAAVAKKFQTKLPLNIVRLDKSGVSLARNSGANTAQGEYLLFLDADLSLPKDFLFKIAKAQQSTGADMMTTHFRASGWHPVDRFLYFADSMVFRLAFLFKKPLMTGCVMIVKKELHHKIGGFNLNLELGEDVDYASRIAKISQKPHFISSIKVVASNRRFKQDGRLHMIGWHWQWTTSKRFPFRAVDKYEFGHYDDEDSR